MFDSLLHHQRGSGATGMTQPCFFTLISNFTDDWSVPQGNNSYNTQAYNKVLVSRPLLFHNNYSSALTILQVREFLLPLLNSLDSPRSHFRDQIQNLILHPTMAVRAQFENSNEWVLNFNPTLRLPLSWKFLELASSQTWPTLTPLLPSEPAKTSTGAPTFHLGETMADDGRLVFSKLSCKMLCPFVVLQSPARGSLGGWQRGAWTRPWQAIHVGY